MHIPTEYMDRLQQRVEEPDGGIEIYLSHFDWLDAKEKGESFLEYFLGHFPQ